MKVKIKIPVEKLGLSEGNMAKTKKETKKIAKKENKKENIVEIKKNGQIFKGVLIHERKIGEQEQVFVKLNGLVSRWFDKKDII